MVRRIQPPRAVEQPVEGLYMSPTTKKTIEDALINGTFQPGAKIAFPLYESQQRKFRIGQTVPLKYAYAPGSSFTYRVKILSLYTKREWATVMAISGMQPVILRDNPMDCGCQIHVLEDITHSR